MRVCVCASHLGASLQDTSAWAVKGVRAWVHPFNGAARKACRPLTGLVCSTPVGWSDIWELTMLPYSSLCLNSTTIHLPSLESLLILRRLGLGSLFPLLPQYLLPISFTPSSSVIEKCSAHTLYVFPGTAECNIVY